jgi:hypothetical protein
LDCSSRKARRVAFASRPELVELSECYNLTSFQLLEYALASESSIFRRWAPHVDADGNVYDLTHVHPLQYTLTLDATSTYEERDVPIHVGFSSHTFTKESDVADAHAAYSSSNDHRRFCLDRYEYSRRLPGIVTNLKGRNCYFNQSRPNYLVAEIAGVPQGFEYWVFFKLKPAGKDPQAPSAVVMMVESAYVGKETSPPYGLKPKRISFSTLVGMVVLGKSPKR